MENVKNQVFQDYLILLNGKLLKFSSFKTNIPAQSINS